MRSIAHVSLALLLLSIPPSLHAEVDWLPADVREAMAQELARNIQAVDVDGKVTPEKSLEGARSGISGIAARVETLGVDHLLQHAPDFPALELPVSGKPHLDAIARYGICTFSLDSVYADDSVREGALEQRATASVMSMSIIIVSAFLRDQYLAAGTTDEDARDFLAGEELNSVSAKVQTSVELLQDTMNRCSAPLTDLLQ